MGLMWHEIEIFCH